MWYCFESSYPTEDEEDVKASFCEELEHAFNKIPKYHMNILLWNVNTKVGMESVKPATMRV
jgi:hypothetical protein